MSKEFADYKTAATRHYRAIIDPQKDWQCLYDWYKDEGRKQFIEAFTKETGLRFGATIAADDLVAAAIPKSYGDLQTKAQDDAFYRAHAAWFLEEMGHIIGCVPRDEPNPSAQSSFGDVLRFVRTVLMDSVLLFEDWGTNRACVPGVFGIGKNPVEHVMAFCQGARQTIYGHGSWGLSFADNHADLATATIRQSIEIRLRRAFGIMGKIRKSDDSIHPIPLADLLDAIDPYKNNVSFPVRFENIKRVNGWANMYLHAALKLYAWSPPRVLAFLWAFLLGGQASGVALDRATFDAIRNIVRQKHEGPTFDLALPDASECDVLIR